LIYQILKLQKSNTILNYIFLGVIVALGILSKYNFALLVLSIFIVSIFNKELQKVLFNKKIFISLAISIIILLPHLYWLINHLKSATSNTIHKMQIANTFNPLGSLKVLFMALIELLAPYLILFTLFFRKSINLKEKNFIKEYLIVTTTLLITVVVSLNMQYFKSRWILPLYLPITIYMALSLKNLDIKRIKYWLRLTIFIMIAFQSAYILRYTNPNLFKKPSRFNYPAKKIFNYLKENNISYKTVFYGNNLLGANLKLYKKDANYIKLTTNTLKQYKKSQNSLLIIDQNSLYYKKMIENANIKLKKINFNYTNLNKKYTIYLSWH